jgi:hypothetical protein
VANFYFEKIRVLKTGVCLNSSAWNNRNRTSVLFCWFSEREVMIKRDRRGHSYCDVRGEILGSSQDEQLRKHLPRMFSLIKNES